MILEWKRFSYKIDFGQQNLLLKQVNVLLHLALYHRSFFALRLAEKPKRERKNATK